MQPMGWKALSNGEGRKTEKNLQVIEKEMGKEEDGGDICQSGEEGDSKTRFDEIELENYSGHRYIRYYIKELRKQ